MKSASNAAIDYEQQLTEEILRFYNDPLGYVRYAFDWGVGELAGCDGPDEWQTEFLKSYGEQLKKADGDATATAIRKAVRSGHGIGKGAVVAWCILHFMSTRVNPQIVVTANTQNQLTTKTWRELSKWHQLAINEHWFTWTATRFTAKDSPSTWFAAAIPWSEHNSEAFAGTHEKNVLEIFDEASAVAPSIWEVTEGAMTTPGAVWLVFGNPTQNTGVFNDCFGKFRHRWDCMTVDSRNAKMANKAQIQQWIDDYGEDSDFVRVRVRGLPPRSSSMQFIGENIIAPSRGKKIPIDAWEFAPVVMGVDPARYGDDRSTIYVRQGLHSHYLGKYRELDLMQLASLTIEYEERYNVDVVFVDEVGLGAGVVDRRRQLGFKTIGINGGMKPSAKKYFNKRAEMWDKMRNWMEDGGAILDDQDLVDDLMVIEYGYDNNKGQLQLEKKEDVKARGLNSPDCADALALTFALPVVIEHNAEQEDRYESARGGRVNENRSLATGY